SDSSNVSGIALQLRETKGPSRLALARCIALASTVLPVPVSPWIKMGDCRRPSPSCWSNRVTLSRTAVIPGLFPISSASGVMGGAILLRRDREHKALHGRRRGAAGPGRRRVAGQYREKKGAP